MNGPHTNMNNSFPTSSRQHNNGYRSPYRSSNPNENNAQWRFDFTYNWIGKQRLPLHSGQSLLKGYSPSYVLMNTQLTRVFSEKFDIYLGAENLGSYTQNNPILGNNNPFGTNFDSTLIYAPINGAMIYLGLRLKL